MFHVTISGPISANTLKELSILSFLVSPPILLALTSPPKQLTSRSPVTSMLTNPGISLKFSPYSIWHSWSMPTSSLNALSALGFQNITHLVLLIPLATSHSPLLAPSHLPNLKIWQWTGPSLSQQLYLYRCPSQPNPGSLNTFNGDNTQIYIFSLNISS